MTTDYCLDLLETIEFLHKENEELKQKLGIQTSCQFKNSEKVIKTFEEFCFIKGPAIERAVRRMEKKSNITEELLQDLIKDFTRVRWNLYQFENQAKNDPRVCFD